MKICNRCLTPKDEAEFAPRKDAPDGRDYRCRQCEAKRRAEYRDRNLEKEKTRENAYAAHRRAIAPEVVNESVREWRRKHPERSRDLTARRRLQYPEMKQAHDACYKLRRPGLQAHHWSYREEHRMDVIHLTRKQHRSLHALMVYDQSVMQFRRKADGLLLDTKEAHLALLVFEQGTFIDGPHFELDQ